MADEDDVRRIALALPSVIERSSYGLPGYRVRDRLFARIHEQPGVLVLWRASVEDREELISAAPDRFFTTPHYADHPTVLLRLAAVDVARPWVSLMRRTSMVLVVGLLLSGCTSSITGAPTPKAAGSALATALSRVPAADVGSGNFEFGDSARLQQLARTDAAVWKFQVNTGASTLSTYAAYTVRTIGVDLSTAGSALTIGQPPRSVAWATPPPRSERISPRLIRPPGQRPEPAPAPAI